jgi:hypothetical protein
MNRYLAVASLLTGLVAVACAGPRAALRPPSPPAPGRVVKELARVAPTGEVAPASADAFPEGDVAEFVGEDRAWHARAREAAAQGDLYVAKRILLRLVAGYRREKLLLAQHEWVQRRLEAEAKPAYEAMKAAQLGAVPAIPPSFRFARAARVAPRPMPKLSVRKSTRNQITDEARWFESVGPTSEAALPPPETRLIVHIDVSDPETDRTLGRLTLGGWLAESPSPQFRRAPFPAWIPTSFGATALSRAIHAGETTLLAYGDRYLFVFDEARKLVRALDLFLLHFPESHLKRAPIKVGELRITTSDGSATSALTLNDHGPRHELRWAQVRDGVLYLSTSYVSYAKEVKGQTAHVTAIELGTGDILFRSAPLTSNSSDFVLVGGAIVTGYGFSAEPDFVCVIDAATGKTVQKIAVPSSPEYFAWSEGTRELRVRTYDHDLVLAVE